MLYQLLKPVAITGINLFFNSISVENQERIPQKGPLIFAANQPNTMMVIIESCAIQYCIYICYLEQVPVLSHDRGAPDKYF